MVRRWEGEVVDLGLGGSGEVEGEGRGFGIIARRIRHVMTEVIAREQGIHGEMSVVTDATNEAMSSAT